MLVQYIVPVWKRKEGKAEFGIFYKILQDLLEMDLTIAGGLPRVTETEKRFRMDFLEMSP